jgi:hypothetical protein
MDIGVKNKYNLAEWLFLQTEVVIMTIKIKR